MIKKVSSFALILLIMSLQLSPLMAVAFGSTPDANPDLGNSPVIRNGPTTLRAWFKIVQDVVGWLFTIAIIVGVAILIIAGIVYITSGGNTGRTGTAGKMVIYAIVGIAVAALAWAIVNLVGRFFIEHTLVT